MLVVSPAADACRARQDLKGGAWCPAQTISAGVREWLEINLHTEYRVTAAETMGRCGGAETNDYLKLYELSIEKKI